MKKVHAAVAIVAGLATGSAADQATEDQSQTAKTRKPAIAASADEVQPLTVGQTIPAGTLRRPDAQTVELTQLCAEKPMVVIFYRGGWCPYCNTHMGQIAKAEPQLIQLGYQVLAVSPDSPESLSETLEENPYSYQLLSDSDMIVTQAFGLAFRVDDATLDQYLKYGINLEKASGRDHHLLPVPAVYIIDTQGVIRFAYWNPDYKTRIAPEELIAAAKQIAER